MKKAYFFLAALLIIATVSAVYAFPALSKTLLQDTTGTENVTFYFKGTVTESGSGPLNSSMSVEGITYPPVGTKITGSYTLNVTPITPLPYQWEYEQRYHLLNLNAEIGEYYTLTNINNEPEGAIRITDFPGSSFSSPYDLYGIYTQIDVNELPPLGYFVFSMSLKDEQGIAITDASLPGPLNIHEFEKRKFLIKNRDSSNYWEIEIRGLINCISTDPQDDCLREAQEYSGGRQPA